MSIPPNFRKAYLASLKAEKLLYPVCLFLKNKEADQVLSLLFFAQELHKIPPSAPSPLMAKIRLTWWEEALAQLSSPSKPPHPALSWIKESWQETLENLIPPLIAWVKSLKASINTADKDSKTHFDLRDSYAHLFKCVAFIYPHAPISESFIETLSFQVSHLQLCLSSNTPYKGTTSSSSLSTPPHATFFYLLAAHTRFYANALKTKPCSPHLSLQALGNLFFSKLKLTCQDIASLLKF